MGSPVRVRVECPVCERPKDALYWPSEGPDDPADFDRAVGGDWCRCYDSGHVRESYVDELFDRLRDAYHAGVARGAR